MAHGAAGSGSDEASHASPAAASPTEDQPSKRIIFYIQVLTGCVHFTGLVPSFPEVAMTTTKSVVIIFCCLILLALALSFGYTCKVYLEGV